MNESKGGQIFIGQLIGLLIATAALFWGAKLAGLPLTFGRALTITLALMGVGFLTAILQLCAGEEGALVWLISQGINLCILKGMLDATWSQALIVWLVFFACHFVIALLVAFIIGLITFEQMHNLYREQHTFDAPSLYDIDDIFRKN